jgi:hypothetical protein
MDFTRLNLKTYRLDEGVATGNNAIEAESKATTNSLENSKPKQMDPRRREAQLNQRTARVGTPTTTQSIVSSHDYFADLRDRKQAINMFEKTKSDWRTEINEAANPDDDPNHPYVEVMPSTSFKAKEAEQNIKKGVVRQKMAGSGPGRAGLDEELLVEDDIQEVAPAAAIPALAGVVAKGAGALAGGAVKGAAAATGATAKAGLKGMVTRKAVGYAANKASDKAEDKVKDLMSSDDSEKTVDEGLTFDDVWAMIEETSPGDYQDTPGKIKSGKILNTKPGVDNFDRTATPKENAARRIVNKKPEIRGKMGKKLVKQVETDAFSDK